MRCRPASSLDLFTDSVRSMGDATMAIVMEFEGQVDRGRLENAFSGCLDAFPILSSRLVRGKARCIGSTSGGPKGTAKFRYWK